MSAPAPLTSWRKRWPQCSHGRRYTYGVPRVEGGIAHWRRTDGLYGSTLVREWGQCRPAHLPGPTWREMPLKGD